MKKNLALIFLFMCASMFGRGYLNPADDEVLSSLVLPKDIYIFKNAEDENKHVGFSDFGIYINKETKEEFVKYIKFGLSEDLFPNESDKTFENIKLQLSLKKNIFSTLDILYFYSWEKSGNAEFSIQYSLGKQGVIDTEFIYVVRIFYENYVYTIRFKGCLNPNEKNDYLDSLTDLLIFKPGTKTDINRGIEGTQGYYWKNRNSPEKFYERLQAEQGDNYGAEFQRTFNELMKSLKEIL
ncbi:MAG: hypothetical protein IK024_06190 [Treponema sp.]|nr:hypothetical protein [Treponema sp.]